MGRRKRRVHMRELCNRDTCHIGPIEVLQNLFCGSEGEAFDMRVDTLVPLNRLDAAIWDSGFRGEILYYPIEDYGVLPDDVLSNLTSKILERINHGNKVGLFCMGGHGRTGYVASVVLGKLGYEDPIQFLRSKYCRKAVESHAQVRHVAKALEKPELLEKYGVQSRPDSFDDLFFNYYSVDGCFPGFACGECSRLIAGRCQEYGISRHKDDTACRGFAARLIPSSDGLSK